jgi:hypothetical protein
MKRALSMTELTEALVHKGLLIADARAAPIVGSDRPWFISTVLGIAGWLAGLFALLFVALLFKPDGAAGYAIAGIITVAAAYGLYRVDNESAFFDQLALALSIAGQLALSVAAWEATESAAGTAALVAVMQMILLCVMPNRFAKMLCAFFACIAWALAVRFAWWGEWSFESHRTQQVDLVPALMGWLVIWLPIILFTHVLIETEPQWMATRWRAIARSGLTGLLLSLAIGTWFSEPFGSLQFWTAGQTHTNWLTLCPLLAVGAALFASTNAFRLRNPGLLGLTIAGALLHLTQFYFLLGTTLLIKACIMLAVGLVLFTAATFLKRQIVLR